MSKRHSPWSLGMLLLALAAAWGQDNSSQQPAETPAQGSPQQPVPAYGSDNPAPSISDNPPISGLDLPNLEPHAAPLSYLQPGAHVSESVDSNIENNLGGSEVQSVSRAEGSLELHRLWSHYDLSFDYLGGVGYYNVHGIGLKQVEEAGLYQKVTWKRGEFGIRDAFSYQPEGIFGSAYGSVGAAGAGLGETGAFFGGTSLGALGQVPRIMNLSLVDVVETLTPKSTLTATAGYGFVHFLQNESGTGNAFIGNSQVSGQLGYSRILGPHDQAAIEYGYQGFQFSTGVTFHSNIIQLMWGHVISGRMDFLIGAGPQFTELNNLLVPVPVPTAANPAPPCVPAPTPQDPIGENCPANDLRISVAGQARLRYQFPKASLVASYEHYLTNGSGFFAGAESDIAHVDVNRPLGRIWSVFADLGYSRNSRVTPSACSTQNCPGVSANTYQYGFAGFGVHRMFGRNFHAFASYQFNELAFDSSFCGTASACNRISQRNVGTIGLDWTPRPIRID
jgi:hypothetical protein